MKEHVVVRTTLKADYINRETYWFRYLGNSIRVNNSDSLAPYFIGSKLSLKIRRTRNKFELALVKNFLTIQSFASINQFAFQKILQYLFWKLRHICLLS